MRSRVWKINFAKSTNAIEDCARKCIKFFYEKDAGWDFSFLVYFTFIAGQFREKGHRAECDTRLTRARTSSWLHLG